MPYVVPKAQTTALVISSAFGSSAPSADGVDYQITVPYNMQIQDILYNCDNHPNSDMTITVQRNLVTVITVTIHPDGTITKSGFPQTFLSGQDLRVTLGNTQTNGNLTGYSYTILSVLT